MFSMFLCFFKFQSLLFLVALECVLFVFQIFSVFFLIKPTKKHETFGGLALSLSLAKAEAM